MLYKRVIWVMKLDLINWLFCIKNIVCVLYNKHAAVKVLRNCIISRVTKVYTTKCALTNIETVKSWFCSRNIYIYFCGWPILGNKLNNKSVIIKFFLLSWHKKSKVSSAQPIQIPDKSFWKGRYSGLNPLVAGTSDVI